MVDRNWYVDISLTTNYVEDKANVVYLGPPFASLETERVQFDAGLELNRNGELIRTSISGKNAPKFVGDPTDEIDSNWEFLIRMYTIH